MSAEVLAFGRGVQMLRGLSYEAERRRRIAIVRVGAFRRAQAGEYTKSDRALFGDWEKIMAEGPGADPRLAPAGDPGVA